MSEQTRPEVEKPRTDGDPSVYDCLRTQVAQIERSHKDLSRALLAAVNDQRLLKASHDALVAALIRSQAVLAVLLDAATAQDQPDELVSSLRDVIHANDLALRER